jgi:hypothetical protein
MKKIAIIVFLTLNLKVQSQVNLVPNPSFEETFSCSDFNLIYLENFIYNWYGGRGYFNVCRVGDFDIPINICGHQYPRSGNAYCGIYTYLKNTYPIRHYIQTKLSETLIENKKYKVSFFVSLGDTLHANCNSIGAFLSTDSFVVSNPGTLLNHIPQIQNHLENDLNNKSGWTMVTDSFIASGNEKWITIGNFYHDSIILVTPLDSVCNQPSPYGCGSYYYIDDVSVTLIDETGIEEKNQFTSSLFPNPNKGIFKLQYNGILNKATMLYITDVYGKIIDTKEILNNTTDYGNTSLSNGLYFYSLRQGAEEVGRGKFVVVK